MEALQPLSSTSIPAQENLTQNCVISRYSTKSLAIQGVYRGLIYRWPAKLSVSCFLLKEWKSQPSELVLYQLYTETPEPSTQQSFHWQKKDNNFRDSKDFENCAKK